MVLNPTMREISHPNVSFKKNSKKKKTYQSGAFFVFRMIIMYPHETPWSMGGLHHLLWLLTMKLVWFCSRLVFWNQASIPEPLCATD